MNDSVITLFLRTALKTLQGKHPLRFAIGVCLGFLLNGVRKGVVVYTAGTQFSDALNAVDDLSTVISGIIMAFIPLLVSRLLGRRAIEEEYLRVFNLIDETIDRAELSEQYRKIAYNVLLNKIVNEFSPPKEASQLLGFEDLGREAAQEVVKDSKNRK